MISVLYFTRLWDWQRSSEAALLATTSGLPSAVKAPAVMCRACCFAPNRPDAIFSVQSGPRGKAYVTEWRYKIVREGESGDGAKGELSCSVEAKKVACVSGHPATTLSVRDDGSRLAVGNVEGSVLIYRLPGFAKVRCLCSAFLCHLSFVVCFRFNRDRGRGWTVAWWSLFDLGRLSSYFLVSGTIHIHV